MKSNGCRHESTPSSLSPAHPLLPLPPPRSSLSLPSQKSKSHSSSSNSPKASNRRTPPPAPSSAPSPAPSSTLSSLVSFSLACCNPSSSFNFSPLLLLLLLTLCSFPIPGLSLNVTNYVPYGQCVVPPLVLKEQVGAKSEPVLSLCLATKSALGVDFDTAERFYIGNGSQLTNAGVVRCFPVEKILTVQEFGNITQFVEGGSIPPESSEQSWDLTVWPNYDPSLKQLVNLTVSNFGATDLQFTGVNLAVAQGDKASILVDYSKVHLSFDSLPLLENYLLNGNDIQPYNPVGIVLLRSLPSTATDIYTFITYAIVEHTPGFVKNNVSTDWSFFLYESTYHQVVSTTGNGARRRLLVAAKANKAPPAACSKGCCKAATPLPKLCSPKAGAKVYPACVKSCGCFCK